MPYGIRSKLADFWLTRRVSKDAESSGGRICHWPRRAVFAHAVRAWLMVADADGRNPVELAATKATYAVLGLGLRLFWTRRPC